MKQREFTVALAKLVIYADSIGCGLTYGDAYAKSGHHDRSTHYVRLAVDFNLFVEGQYITSSENHMWAKLHDYWLELGGSAMIDNDANHFSFSHNGVR